MSSVSPVDFDLAVVGSGFGGSLLAMIARRIGLSVLLLEAGKHPRFAIGESTSPLTNLILEQLAERYNLPNLLPLAQWGTWKERYPNLGVGLKRGFTYYAHEVGKAYQARPDRANQLLVAASPHDHLADTHWYRADVDAFLVGEAVALGAEYRDETRLSSAEPLPGGSGMRLTGASGNKPFAATARFVVDASGARGFLWRALGLREGAFPGYPGTRTLYSHFTGVARTDAMPAYADSNGETPPYPPDDAALHHVFDGGWMWVLRFDHGVTSAGVAAEDWLADELNLGEGGPSAWQRFLDRFPSVREQFADAEPVEPFHFAPRLSWRVGGPADVAGPCWALLPSAAAFVDPLYSTGFPLMLLGIERLAAAFSEAWGTDELPSRLCAYADKTLSEADGTAAFIAGNYRAFPRFASFASLSMFYFAAASYSEIARRLGKPERLLGYLAPNCAPFRDGMARASRRSPEVCPEEVAAAIAPVNVAGLCRPEKRNWYGVELADLVDSAEKLGETPDAMRRIIATAPWARVPLAPPPSSLRLASPLP